MKHRLFVAFGTFCLALGILTCLSFARDTRPRLQADKFREIKPGMTHDQVIELLGAPPGNYARNGYMIQAYGIIMPAGVKREEWIDDAGMYEVHYNRDG